jgi:hypothetical protein
MPSGDVILRSACWYGIVEARNPAEAMIIASFGMVNIENAPLFLEERHYQ